VALYGTTKNDTLTSNSSDDLLIGRAGADTFVFGKNAGYDKVIGFDQDGNDAIRLTGLGTLLDTYEEILPFLSAAGPNSVLDLSVVVGLKITFENTPLSLLGKDDFIFI
jgi:Ca2+-binding RTX toxin-like protein